LQANVKVFAIELLGFERCKDFEGKRSIEALLMTGFIGLFVIKRNINKKFVHGPFSPVGYLEPIV
jgi:hypothetical protein